MGLALGAGEDPIVWTRGLHDMDIESHAYVRFERAGESFRYLLTQSIGSAINLVVFSGMVMVFGAGTLLAPLAVGAAAGLVSNFLMSKYVVFSERPRM